MAIGFVFLPVGLLYIGMGFPLFLGKVGRNAIYGFRLKKTLSDDKYWYPVNKVAGKWFIVAGLAIVVAALFLPFLNQSESDQIVFMLVVIIAATSLPIIFGLRLMRQIP